MAITLYEVAQKLLNCIKVSEEDTIDAETGEVIDAEQIDALQMTYDEKVENIGRWIKNLRAEGSAIREEERKLAARRRSLENKAESLTKYLSICTDGKKFSSPTVSISYRTSTTVDVDMEQFQQFDGCDEYLKYEAPSPRKDEIKRALKEGIELPGCTLVTNNNIQIK